MPIIKLDACTATPFGCYLKSIGVLRLVAEQADRDARGWWDGEVFKLESKLGQEELLEFFLARYEPTPILAPWNGGSGFYPKDNKDGVDAIAGTTSPRFAEYRVAIAMCREFPEVLNGKGGDEEARRAAILRRCRNQLSDRAVEWLDAAVGIAADGSRSFAPVLGTGGNEGRLDYTNNFMSRIAALLIAPDSKTPVRELLANALFGARTTALQPGAAGQYDPGRAGGANQGPGIEHDAPTNPWDLVLTLEGAVAWASGLYRRQGVGYGSFLCSPFTVRSKSIGYGSASDQDEARAEVWTPLWSRPAGYPELKALLREGRASVEGRPARNALEFAEAASSLGVDRGISRFVRYSLLKRRGDSYVALPAGTFPTGYRSNTDRIREFLAFVDALSELPKGAEDLRRCVESAVYQALLNNQQNLRDVMAALGRLVRRIATTTETRLRNRAFKAGQWLSASGFEKQAEVRIAAALASIWTPGVGGLAENLSRAGAAFAWTGISLSDRMICVLERRIQSATAHEADTNPLGAACAIDPGDATLFIEGSVDDSLIEELLFAFLVLDWQGFEPLRHSSAEVLPIHAVLKCLFLPGEVQRGAEPKRLRADQRILSLLKAGSVEEAAEIAVSRLRIAGLRPLDTAYAGGVDPRRLAASLLIPVWQSKLLACGIFHEQESSAVLRIKENYESELIEQ
jgi:CRISPR-associated protein Csx17